MIYCQMADSMYYEGPYPVRHLTENPNSFHHHLMASQPTPLYRNPLKKNRALLRAY